VHSYGNAALEGAFRRHSLESFSSACSGFETWMISDTTALLFRYATMDESAHRARKRTVVTQCI